MGMYDDCFMFSKASSVYYGNGGMWQSRVFLEMDDNDFWVTM